MSSGKLGMKVSTDLFLISAVHPREACLSRGGVSYAYKTVTRRCADFALVPVGV